MSLSVSIIDGPIEAAHPVADSFGGGAVLCFEGIVRPSEAGRAIRGIDYQTYDPMAGQELARLGRQTIERFGLLALEAQHSRGFVPNHARSFRLRLAAAHRKEALAAMDWFIDQMKKDVPIWKHPAYADDVARAAP